MEIRKGGKGQRVERKQRDLACSGRREVAIRIVGTEFEKTEGGGGVASVVQGNGRGLLYSEQNCDEMAAARGYATQRKTSYGTPLRKGCLRKGHWLINIVTSVEHIESNREFNRRTEALKIIHILHF